jgi:hypothetical protein
MGQSAIDTRHRSRAGVCGGALAALLLVSSAPAWTAPADLPDRMEIKGKQFLRVGDQWYRQVAPHLRLQVQPDVVTVKFKSGIGEMEKGGFLSSRSVRKLRANRLGAVDVTVPAGMSAVEFVAKLQEEGALEYAEVNVLGRYEQVIPDDTRFADLWGLDNTGQTGGTVDADIDAPEAWDLLTTPQRPPTVLIDYGQGA